MENKYKTGQVIYSAAHEGTRFVVRRYLDRIYYCRKEPDIDLKDFVFFEREITEIPIASKQK